MSALIWLWVYNHDFDLQLDQIHKVCLDIWDVLLCLSVWRACLVICKSAKKRYVMRMCISWLCPCKGKNISCSSRIYPPFISYSTSATTTLNFLPSIPLGVDKLCLFCRILSNRTTPGLVNWLHVPIYGQEKQSWDVDENDNKNSLTQHFSPEKTADISRLASPRTSAEIPYCGRVITQIWVVLLIGWSKFPTRYDPDMRKTHH